MTVIRLASVSDDATERLLRRGVPAANISELLQHLRRLGIVFEPEQLIDEVFDPSKTHETPFKPTRFTDGQRGVFYSALEDETSIEEVRYYQRQSGEFAQLDAESSAAPRHFWLYDVDFRGRVLDLFDLHPRCPELTSKNEDGYPKCRELADDARSKAIDAFRTPSARRPGGTCTPVFDRHSLRGVPRVRAHGHFVHENGDIIFRRE